jgi:branched-chain amino acid transport system substrate-binding protein
LRRLAVLLLGALLAGGCGGGDDDRPRVPDGDALKVYTSLPRHGDSASAGEAALAGQRLALEDHKGRAGDRRVELVPLEATEPDDITWDPELVEKNAGRAADDRAAIAYLGELDNGGSAISVPVTNDAGLLHLAPQDGLTSLTQFEPGGPRGGPERYWPTGRRTFARLVPTDLSLATALVDLARDRGAKRIAILHDDHVHGRALAAQSVFVADARKLPVASVNEVEADDDPEAYADAAEKLADDEKERPDAVLYTGVATRTGVPLIQQVRKALPRASVYAAGAPPESFGETDVRVVSTTLPARDYPPRAQRVLDRIAAEQRGTVPPVAALYGYESMRLALEAIDRAGQRAGDRAAVRREALRTGSRPGSVLGDLSLTGTGDVADQRVMTYRRTGGRLTAEGLRTPRPPALPPQPGDPSS